MEGIGNHVDNRPNSNDRGQITLMECYVSHSSIV